VESSSRRSLSIGVFIALLAGATAAVASSKAGPPQPGTFALLGGSAQVVSQLRTEPAPSGGIKLKIRQFQTGSKTAIINYATEMERQIHLIVIRDDFATFSHEHPAFDVTTGTFLQTLTGLAAGHRYYVYADTTPQGLNQQVFRFTLPNGASGPTPAPNSVAPEPSATAGSYTIALSTATLTAGAPTKLEITILQNGKPAPNLGTYLGAPAHAVLINTSTLQYVHAHPMVKGSSMASGDMSQAGNDLIAQLPGLPAGVYKLWVQFRGANSTIYTAPFTLVAR
jgi:hypothetical protein